MTKQERREAIVKAVMPVFADKGFHGATTKDLAGAAGVSEALLYKHFPSKEALYSAIGAHHLGDQEAHPGLHTLVAMPPSTARLVLSLQYLIAHTADPSEDVFARLMAQSLLGDGAFARTVFRAFKTDLSGFVIEAMAAARQAGDIDTEIVPEVLPIWFAHHLAMALKLLVLPGEAVVDYECPRDVVVDQAVRFVLRGLGLKPEAFQTYYDPQAWRQL